MAIKTFFLKALPMHHIVVLLTHPGSKNNTMASFLNNLISEDDKKNATYFFSSF